MLFALSTESEIALALAGGIFIAFALVCSFVMPRRNPDFPGKRWRNLYIVLCIALFLGMMSTVIAFGKDEEEKHAEEVAASNPTETTSTPPTTTTEPGATTPTTTGGAALTGDAAAGKVIFESKGCVACHTLAAAGATGTVGPNLDEAKPDVALITDRVTNGKGAMPPFKDQLTEQQIADVAAFVHESTQSG